MKTKKIVQVFLLGTMIMFLGLLLGGRPGLLLGLLVSLLIFWLSLQDETLFLIKKNPHRLIKGQDFFGLSQEISSSLYVIEIQDAFICSGPSWGAHKGWIAISETLATKLKKDELKALLHFHDRWILHRSGYWTRLSAGVYVSLLNFLQSFRTHHLVSAIVLFLARWLTFLPGLKKYLTRSIEETPIEQKESLARALERLQSYAINIPTQVPSTLDFLFIHPQRPCRHLSNPYIRMLVGYEPL